MSSFIESQGRFVEEISQFAGLRNRMVERERFFTVRSATDPVVDSAAIRMERSIAESLKFLEPLQNLQNIIRQHYSVEALDQMSRVADSINRSARWLMPQNFSEIAKALNAFQQSERQRMAEAVKMSRSVLSSIPILQKSEYEEEQLRKSAEILRKVEVALEKLPPELQKAFWEIPLEEDFAKATEIVLNPNLTDEQRAAELATFFAGGEIEPAWMQIRRILYPLVKGINPWFSLLIALLLQCLDKEDKTIFIPVLLVLAVIYSCGDPDGDENPTRRNK